MQTRSSGPRQIPRGGCYLRRTNMLVQTMKTTPSDARWECEGDCRCSHFSDRQSGRPAWREDRSRNPRLHTGNGVRGRGEVVWRSRPWPTRQSPSRRWTHATFSNGTVFSNLIAPISLGCAGQVISAAIAEQGIALGRLKLLCPMLSDGRLRELMGTRAGSTTSYAYWSIQARAKPRPDVLTTPAGLCRRPKRANRIWMSSLVPRKVALTAHQASERYLQGRYVPIGFAQSVHGSVTFRRDRHGAVIQVL